MLRGISNFCKMANKIPSMKLPSGADMPIVGLGTWKSKPGEVENAVKVAIDAGYRHIDCAFIYGNEKEVGAAVKEKIEEGKVKREDLFIVSKLWNTRHSPADVKPSLMESLSNLGLEYLDLYLIHWPHSFKPGQELFPKDEAGNVIYADINPVDTWKEMEKCVEEGLVKDIGLSNFNSEQIQTILDNCKVKPANNQVECHPYFSNKKLAEFCEKKGVTFTAYSPLGSADRPWAPKGEPLLVEDPKLKEIAEKYKKTPAQVILRWLVHRGIIIIPKSVTPSRIQENFDLFNFELATEDIETINGFDKNVRMVAPYIEVDGKRVFRDRNAPYFPFNIEF